MSLQTFATHRKRHLFWQRQITIDAYKMRKVMEKVSGEWQFTVSADTRTRGCLWETHLKQTKGMLIFRLWSLLPQEQVLNFSSWRNACQGSPRYEQIPKESEWLCGREPIGALRRLAWMHSPVNKVPKWLLIAEVAMAQKGKDHSFLNCLLTVCVEKQLWS